MQEMQGIWFRPLFLEDSLEEEMAPHSSFPAWTIPCTEEPGGLQSTGPQKESDMTERAHTVVGYALVLLDVF